MILHLLFLIGLAGDIALIRYGIRLVLARRRRNAR